MFYYLCCVMMPYDVPCVSRCPFPPFPPDQRAYLTREQCDVAIERMRSGDAAAMGLWSAFEGRGYADFLSFLQPLQVMRIAWVVVAFGSFVCLCASL